MNHQPVVFECKQCGYIIFNLERCPRCNFHIHYSLICSNPLSLDEIKSINKYVIEKNK